MFLKVLVDNNTIVDDYALGEPALSFYIEVDNKKILFDTGYSDVLIKNAKHYNIDLSDLDYIVLSHGHNDHTRGLQYLLDTYDLSDTYLIAHPHAFNDKMQINDNIGNPVKFEDLENKIKVILTKKTYQLTKNLIFLGEIPRVNDFECKTPIGMQNEDGVWSDDYLDDDTALIYIKEGLHIITGCSHSGICNIIEYGKVITNERNIQTVIGGFHLFIDDKRLNKTIEYFKSNKINTLLPCHCVSFNAKIMINKSLSVGEVGVGFELRI